MRGINISGHSTLASPQHHKSTAQSIEKSSTSIMPVLPTEDKNSKGNQSEQISGEPSSKSDSSGNKAHPMHYHATPGPAIPQNIGNEEGTKEERRAKASEM